METAPMIFAIDPYPAILQEIQMDTIQRYLGGVLRSRRPPSLLKNCSTIYNNYTTRYNFLI